MKALLFKTLTAVLALAVIITSSACTAAVKEASGVSSSAETSTDSGLSDDSTAPTDSSTAKPETANAKISITGGKFTVDGKEIWINGVNTPWHRWNDFTGAMDEEFWDNTFAQLVSDGVNCTRIWINCNGENIVRLKSDGSIKNINEGHWSDLDTLFSLAEKHRIYIMPTLLSFDHCKGNDASAKKWRALIMSKEACYAFANTYVSEFCERYGEHPYLFGIDLMNEPDWVYENDECGRLPWDNLCYLFGKCAEVIHEKCSTPVTVGFGMIKYNSSKYEGDKLSDDYLKKLTGSDKSNIDFYSTHYYMWEKAYFGFPFDSSPQDFGLYTDKPCIIGETSNDDRKESKMNVEQKYKSSYENGWNGVMVWMEPQQDNTWSAYDLTAQGTNAMRKMIPEKIDPLGA